MGKQIIFCVETNRKSNNDYIYVKAIVSEYYCIDEEIKLTPIYLEGKHNYNRKKIVKEIKAKVKMFEPNGETIVIYVLDKDKHTSVYKDAEFITEVTKYCKKNEFESVWFVETIEDVMIGKKINDHDKTKTAVKFKKSKQIKTIAKKKLSVENPLKPKTSNILFVLDKYL